MKGRKPLGRRHLPTRLVSRTTGLRCGPCIHLALHRYAKKRGAREASPPYIAHKGANMEYLILVAVVAVMVLYALIIVGCLKQPEW